MDMAGEGGSVKAEGVIYGVRSDFILELGYLSCRVLIMYFEGVWS